MRATPAASLHSEINVTPLVDVCLVLLIIFMVVTPLLSGVPVQLPQSVTAEELAKQPLQITINADRTIYVGDAAIHEEQLASELARHAGQTSRPVVVRGDKSLAYGDIVRVLDTCRAAGFQNVGLATTR
jgi:biopolymer transport protein ExbD